MPERPIRPAAAGLVLLAICMAGGCARTRNEKFTPENVAKVSDGVASERGITLFEVEAVLGPGADYSPPGRDGGLRWKRWEREKDGDSLAVAFGADGRAVKSEYQKWGK